MPPALLSLVISEVDATMPPELPEAPTFQDDHETEGWITLIAACHRLRKKGESQHSGETLSLPTITVWINDHRLAALRLREDRIG
jgi:hypothetical protein